jgi:O-antigen ligase
VSPERREQSIAERLEVPRLSLQLVAQRPLLGHGGGTYSLAFPSFKQAHLPLHWDHAHNDFVQVACDTGLVGLALWLAIGLASARRALQLIDDSRSQVQRGVGIGALMAMGCMALHSTVDFNLHIPANAMTFTVLLAAVWASSEQRKSK